MDKPILWLPEAYLNTSTGLLKVPAPEPPKEETQAEANAFWAVVEELTEDHWLEVVDPEGYYEAVVKWDGCVHLYMHDSPIGEDDEGEDGGTEYLHICELDELIDRLQALKEIALQHFKGNWPG